MRRIVIIGLVINSVFLMTSCKKFLAQEPYNNISLQDIFKDFEGARTTLVGCYDNLRSTNYYLRDFYVYPELTGGNAKYTRPSNLLLLQSYNFSNDPIENDMTGFYRIAYSTIYNCNNIIQNINQVADATTTQKNRMLADALTIRALVHFDLMRVFAQSYSFSADAGHEGIVLRTVNSPVTAPPSSPQSAKEVFSQVVSDLDSAINLYSNSVPIYTGGTEKTFLSQDAANAILSRVTLYKQDWARVITLSSDLISSGRYQLISNSQYVNSWSRKNISSESIFELAYGNRIGGSLGDYYNPTNTQFGQLAATTDITSLYSTGDVRGVSSMYYTTNVNNLTYNFTRKYQGMNDSANNIKIIRLSEIYLNRAEAYAESGNLISALADLNVIRKRANPSAINFAATDKQVLLDEIFRERRRELAFEGHTFFDISRQKRNLVRSDCSSTNCSFNYPSLKFAVPKPVIQ